MKKLKRNLLAKQITLLLCGGALLLGSGCSSEHNATLDGTSGSMYPSSTTDEITNTVTYIFDKDLDDQLKVKEKDKDAIGIRAEERNITLVVDREYSPKIEVEAQKNYAAIAMKAASKNILLKNNFSVRATAENGLAMGAYATGKDSRIDFLGDTDITATSNNNTYGVNADSNAQVNFKGMNTSIHSISNNSRAYGINADSNAQIQFTGNHTNITATSNNDSAYGIAANSNAQIKLGGSNTNITANANTNAYGVNTGSGAQVNFNSSDRTTITATSINNAYGVYAGSNSQVNFTSKETTINAASNKNAYGVNADSRAQTIFAGSTHILAKSNDVNAETYGVKVSDGTVNFQGPTSIDSWKIGAEEQKTLGYGVWNSSGTVNFSDTAKINGNLLADAGGINFYRGADIVGNLTARSNGNINFSSTLTTIEGDLSSTGEGSSISFDNAANITGNLLARSKGNINFSSALTTIKGDLSATGEGSNIRFDSAANITGNLLADTGGISFAKDTAINGNLTAKDKGTINFSNAVLSTIKGNVSATSAGGISFESAATITGNLLADSGRISFNKDATIMGDLTAKGSDGKIDFSEAKHNITGNLSAINNGIINLNMTGNNSLWSGTAMPSNSGQINIGLYQGANWTTTGKSMLTSLKTDTTQGIINQNTAENIQVGTFSGNVKVNYQSSLSNNQFQVNGGKFIIDQATAGSLIKMNTDTLNTLNQAQTKSGLDQLANKLEYKGDPNNLKATATINEGKITPGVSADITFAPDSNVGVNQDSGFALRQAQSLAFDKSSGQFQVGNITYGAKETTTMKDLKAAQSVNLLAWRAENSDMQDRLGELRSVNGQQGLWARMLTGETKYDQDTSFKNKYQTFQVGYDKRISEKDNDAWFVGGALSYTDGSTDYDRGNGENSATGLTLYGSWLGSRGHFLDLTVKGSRLSTDYTLFEQTADPLTSGSYDNWGSSISAAYGRRMDLADQWYFEPQAGLAYGHVNSSQYTTSNAILVNQDGMDSLVGHVGFSLGRTLDNGSSLYFSASALHDFDGKTGMRFAADGAENSLSQDYGGTWYEFGLGGNFVLSDHSYAYANIERTTGGEVETPWRCNVGVRFTY